MSFTTARVPYPLGVGVNTHNGECTDPGDGKPGDSGAENFENNTHQEGNVAVSPVTLVTKALAYFSSI